MIRMFNLSFQSLILSILLCYFLNTCTLITITTTSAFCTENVFEIKHQQQLQQQQQQRRRVENDHVSIATSTFRLLAKINSIDQDNDNDNNNNKYNTRTTKVFKYESITKILQRQYQPIDKSNSNVLNKIMMTTMLTVFLSPFSTMANEIGVEVEAPTFITGETVEICTKRGILGACVQTEMRTAMNDNDVAKKYYSKIDLSSMKKLAATATAKAAQQESTDDSTNDNNENDQANVLIQKLRQQSIDNAEKNNLLVQRKTFENNQAATFGPFDRQILVMNVDGKTFTLLQNPQAMRLKKDGYINDRREFIKQPTQEVIDTALTTTTSNENEESVFPNLFGNKE